MRASKRSKKAQCACGRLGEDTCSICQIIINAKKRRAVQWDTLRLGEWSDHWLYTASDIVVDGGSKDVVSIVAQRKIDMTNDEINVCARLVAELHRRNQRDTGQLIFSLCKKLFERLKSEFCIIASSYYEILENCQPEAYQIAKKARDMNRLSMAKCIADMYRIKIKI